MNKKGHVVWVSVAALLDIAAKLVKMVTNKLFNMGITKVVKLDLYVVKMVLFALSSLQPVKPISGFSFPRQSEKNQVNTAVKE